MENRFIENFMEIFPSQKKLMILFSFVMCFMRGQGVKEEDEI